MPRRNWLHGVDMDAPARRWVWRGLSRSPDVFVALVIPRSMSHENETISVKVMPGKEATEEQLFAPKSRLVPSRAMTAAALGIVPGVFLGAITRRVLSAIGARRHKGILQVVIIGVACIYRYTYTSFKVLELTSASTIECRQR